MAHTSPEGAMIDGDDDSVRQHTNTVLGELGYTPEQVDDLRPRGIVGG